jgi:hypothetical protein
MLFLLFTSSFSEMKRDSYKQPLKKIKKNKKTRHRSNKVQQEKEVERDIETNLMKAVATQARELLMTPLKFNLMTNNEANLIGDIKNLLLSLL